MGGEESQSEGILEATFSWSSIKSEIEELLAIIEQKRKIERECDSHIADIDADIGHVSSRYGKDMGDILANIEKLEDSKNIYENQLVCVHLLFFVNEPLEGCREAKGGMECQIEEVARRCRKGAQYFESNTRYIPLISID